MHRGSSSFHIFPMRIDIPSGINRDNQKYPQKMIITYYKNGVFNGTIIYKYYKWGD
jgi:hypothetical protein